MSDLPARFTGEYEGFSIDVYATDKPHVLVIAATNADGESIEVPFGVGQVTGLWGFLREWTYEAVGKDVPTDKP